MAACPAMRDSHTLYVKTYATAEQLSAAVREALERAGLDHPEHKQIFDSATYTISVVCIPDVFHFGYAYLWVDDPRLYRMFLGLNPDGTERWDIDWTAPAEPKPDLEVAGKSWADAVEEEEAVEQLYTRPKLGPLIELLDLPYASGQQDKVQAYLAKASGQRPDLIIPPPCVRFEVEPATASEVEPNVKHNVLYVPDVPAGIAEADLEAIFKRFSTSKNKNYPTIALTSTRTAFVTYDEKTRDASFARMLTRKLRLTGKNGRQNTVVVDYSQKKAGEGWQTVPKKKEKDKRGGKR